MSKKKNVRRKKSNNLLKGVAAAGAVVGGGTIFAGNNAVYAAELDNESQVSDLSESQASTSSYMSESLSQSDSTTEDYTSIENSTNASVSASASDSTVESENNSIVESNSISDSVSLSESQLASTSESESISASVSDSESLVNSESVKNDEVSSNKFGNLINGLFKDKNVSAANYTTNTVGNSTMPITESGSIDLSTSISKYFSESVSTSNSISTAYGNYGSEVAENVLKNDNAYVMKSESGPIKEGVLVKNNNDGWDFIYLYNGKALKTQINKKYVTIDSDGNANIQWNGYYITGEGKIEKLSPITDQNTVSGDKTFMTIYENGQPKDVFVVKDHRNGADYWIPVKVNNNYVEIQNGGDKVHNTEAHKRGWFVQIKIGNAKFYLDKASYSNGQFNAIMWETSKYSGNLFIPDTEPDFHGTAVLDSNKNNWKIAIGDMIANKTSYSKTYSSVSETASQSTSASTSASQSTSASVSASQSASASVSASGSTSESVNTSESISESISESLSVSESESISGSMSDSVSTSTAVSESLSNSLSSSESNSLSSSESASVSDSFATSVTTTTTGGDTTYRRVVVDTRAPLQVAPRGTEEVVEDETPKANPEKETETIEKEKMPKSTLDVTHRVWWSWVPIVGALVSLVNAHASKKARNDASKEKEDK